MKKSESLFQKIFGSFAVGSSRVPIRSNVYSRGTGYSAIGTTGSRIFDMDRKSPLLGNAAASNLLSGYLDRVLELKGYQLLDISKLATNFYADYVTNFLLDGTGQQIVSVLNDQGENDEMVTERINDILTKDIKVFDFIRDHIQDYIFFGEYYSMLLTSRDELGHLKFRVEEINDPVSVIIKKKRNKKGEMEEVFLAKGEDGTMYEIPRNEVIYIASNNLRLINDLEEGWKEKAKEFRKHKMAGKSNREKVLRRESFTASEPLFYSLILKVKELIIKELLVSLISLRDLSSVQIFLLQFDKSVPLESANELCARATKLTNNTNELASFLTSQFDVISFIENTLTQSAKFVPDYNSTLGGKNSMLPLDKLTDKLLDIMQSIDQCKANVLNPLGLPSTIVDSTSGSKWMVLQQSERANSRVTAFMSGIKDSVTNLVCTIYRILYNKELDPALIRLHISEKTSVEYNNQINQSESVNNLLQGITGMIQNALQTLEVSAPLIDPKTYISWIQNLMRDIDPNTEALITDSTIQRYLTLLNAKTASMLEQQGIDPSILQESEEPKSNVGE